MRDVIAGWWTAHLDVDYSPESNASVCFAALTDIVARLIGVAEAIHRRVNAAWVIDPDGVALGYAPPSAPVAAVSLLPRDVLFIPSHHDSAPPGPGGGHTSVWPVLDPLVRAWCHDGDLDLARTCRTLGRSATPTG